MSSFFIVFIPLSLAVNSFFIFLFKKWIGPLGIFYFSILIIFFVISILFIILINNAFMNSYYYIDFGRWFSILDFIDSHLVFCVDNLSIITSIVVLLLTSLAQLFGVEYMYREAFISRLIYLLNMFATSVILLFFVYDFFLILIVWELIGLFSFLLVNFYSQRVYTIKAAFKTFIFSRVSDMFLFLAFTIIIFVMNTTDLSIIFIKTPFYIYHNIFIGNFSFNYIDMLTLSIALASVIKGAQFFFHVWLPDAMEAPTPASALIHSSTLVIMGIYLIIRLSFIFEFSILTNYFLAIIGSFTIGFASIVAILQNDIKKLVAYSTISQMGYLVCGCGLCSYEEVIIYLISHAFNKAFLFILVGYTVHFFNGNTDLRQMGGAYLYSFDIYVFFLLLSFNLIGLPYSAGFYSKEFLLFQTLRDGFLSYIIRSSWLISFFCTPMYMLLLSTLPFLYFKKSSKVTFSNFWLNNYSFKITPNMNNKLLLTNYQYSLFLSRFTGLVLFLFLFIIYFLGETLLLVKFNFLISLESIYSSSFIYIKNNSIAFITNFSSFLFKFLLFLILFFFLLINIFFFTFKRISIYKHTFFIFFFELFMLTVVIFYL